MLENEVVEVQTEEEKPLKQPIGNALTAFILAFFGAIFSLTGLLSLPGVVLGILGIAFANKCENVTRRPFVAFKRVARPLSIAAIAVGAVLTTVITIGLIVLGIYLLVKNGTAQ